ncbi:MAG: GDP-mannose 4,6-dehydratase [Kiritimatiellae bacterium]|nr:GDP-mannose 4,6-dehydratase [Kiritimatiellia bacterium]
MRVLVTGSQGFVGRHLVEELRRQGWTIGAFDLPAPGGLGNEIRYYQGDIQDRQAVDQAVKLFLPEACIHLSGIAFVPMGWTNAETLFAINVSGTIHLLEACRKHAPAARVLVISSAEVYGRQTGRDAADEDSPFHPENPYAVSKAAADQTALLYARQYSMPVMAARPGNHIGPGQSPDFVVPSFARQLGEIAARRKKAVIKVGNLDSTRDFTDVRDVARAYRLLIEKGRAGEAYNIASNREVSIRFILDRLCRIAGIDPDIEVAPERYRQPEQRARLATSKITRETGWKPEISLETSLRNIMKEYINSGNK